MNIVLLIVFLARSILSCNKLLNAIINGTMDVYLLNVNMEY